MFAYFKQLHDETEGNVQREYDCDGASGNRMFVEDIVSGGRRGAPLVSRDVTVLMNLLPRR
jgi:hypothetical protein